MDDAIFTRRSRTMLVACTLTTANAALLALPVTLAAYRGGGLARALASLDTLVGLALFGLLWLLAGVPTVFALRNVERVSELRVFDAVTRGGRYGAYAGAAVFGALFLAGVVLAAGGAVPTLAEPGREWTLGGVFRGTFVAVAVGGALAVVGRYARRRSVR